MSASGRSIVKLAVLGAAVLGIVLACSVRDGSAALGATTAGQQHALQHRPGISDMRALPHGVRAAAGEEKRKAMEAFDLSPAVFVENKGQWDESIRYGFDGKGVRVSFTDAGPVFQMLKASGTGEDAETSQTVFSAAFVGAKQVRPTALDPSPSTVNYYRGNDPSRWQSGVPTFRKVVYKGLYEGVDLHTWGKRSGLKYEFHVAPGADWRQIVVRYEGIEGLAIDEKGALHVKTALGEMDDDAPVVYQEREGQRVDVAARFRLIDEHSYGFEISGALNASLPVVIDPYLAWGSYLGGSDTEYGRGVAIDNSGNCYLTGCTKSVDFPTTGGFDTSYGGGTNVGDVYVAKVTASGTLAWSSYLGGSNDDEGLGIGVDAAGNCYIAGCTMSADFPTPGGFDTTFGGGQYENDAFIAKVTPSGALAWSSYLGGSRNDRAFAMAVDGSGTCYVTGDTESSDFPIVDGFDTSPGGNEDAFIAKVTSSGTLAWSSYFGGTSNEEGWGIAADSNGNCYLSGFTTSSDLATPGAFDTTYGDNGDAFVAKVTPSGTLAWASYLGGSGFEWAYGKIAVDSAGNCYVNGTTQSSDFPTTGGFDTSLGGASDAFVTKVTTDGALAWSSYLGGSGNEVAYCAATDAEGNCYLTGFTYSTDFPTPGGFCTQSDGSGFLTKVAPGGELVWSTCLPGTGWGFGVAADPIGTCYVTGHTSSSDFPATGGFDTSLGGTQDAFVVKVAPSGLVILTSTLPRARRGSGYSQTLTADGGVLPYSWSVSSGSLPAGLSLNASTGVISGTPSATGTAQFTVRVTDSAGPAATATRALSISVAEALSISTSSLANGHTGVAYSQTLAATGGIAPYSWSVLTGSLPAGLTLHAATGVIDGTPTAAGTANFTVRVTDNPSPSATATKALSISVTGNLSVATATLPNARISASYSQTLAATGGVTPYSWSVSAGSLPAGLSLNASSGVISGTPSATGLSSFTVRVADSQSPSATATKALSIRVVTHISIVTASLQGSAPGIAYSETLIAQGGVTPYTWSISSGSLPPGLSLDGAAGVISGTPTDVGIYNFTVGVADSQSPADTAQKALHIIIGSGPTYYFIASDGEQSTASTAYVAKAILDFDPPTADDWLIFGFCEWKCPNVNYATYVQMFVDGVGEGQNTRKPVDPTDYMPFITVKGTQLAAGPHRVQLMYRAGNAAAAAYIRKARICAVRKAALEYYNVARDSAVPLDTDIQDITSLTWTPVIAGNYIVISTAELNATTAVSTKIQTLYNGIVNDEGVMRAADNGDYTTFMSFNYLVAPALVPIVHKISACKVTAETANHYVRRARILALRLSNGRFNYAAAGYGMEKTTTQTSFQEAISTSWTCGVSGNWLFLNSARVVNTSTNCQTELRVQLNDSSICGQQLMKPKDATDLLNYSSIDVRSLTAPRKVDMDFRTTNVGGTAKVRRLRFYGLPLDAQ